MKKLLLTLVLATVLFGGDCDEGIAYNKGFEYADKKLFKKAEKVWLECANKGHKIYNFPLGYIYSVASDSKMRFNPLDIMNKNKNPYSVLEDKKSKSSLYDKAIKHLSIVAKDDNLSKKIPLSCSYLGNLYYTGNYIMNMLLKQPDYKKAKKWSLKAIETDNKEAISISANNLGLMYLNGQGVLQDFSQAKKYFNLAIKNEMTIAKCNLGTLYIKRGQINQAKKIIREGYQDGEEYCGEIWNQNNLGQ